MRKKLDLLAPLAAMAIFILGTMMSGCGTDATTTAVNADAVVIPTVNAAMQIWAAEVNAGKATSNQIVSVSNSYAIYYQSQLILSNLAMAYVTTPSTNLSQAITTAEQAVAASGSNVVAIVNAFK
jgi:hypothetical protein